jgi:hypothetical protein
MSDFRALIKRFKGKRVVVPGAGVFVYGEISMGFPRCPGSGSQSSGNTNRSRRRGRPIAPSASW